MNKVKNFFLGCVAAMIVLFGVVFVITGIVVMIVAFAFMPIIWTLAKFGCPWARFDEREISLGRFIKLTFYPK